MTCEHCSEKFSELHDGALAHAEAEALRAHIAVCPRCERDYAEFAAVVDGVRSLELLAPPAHLPARIARALDDEQPRHARAPQRRSWAPALAAAACVMVALVGIHAVRNSGLMLPAQRMDDHAAHMIAPVMAPAPASDDAEVGAAHDALPPTGVEAASTSPGEIAPAPPTPAAADGGLAASTAAAVGPTRRVTPAGGRASTPLESPSTVTPAAVGDSRRDETRHGRAPIPVAPSPLPVPRRAESPFSAEEVDVVAPIVPPSSPSVETVRPGLSTRTRTSEERVSFATDSGVAREPMGPPKMLSSVGGTVPEVGRLDVRFVPPVLREVGTPVTSAIWVNADTDLERADVRVETRSDLTVLHADSGYVFRGPLRAAQPREVEFKLLAQRPGTQRLRITVETPVRGLQAQMEAILPGFVAADHVPASDPLGKPVTLTLNETPLRDALIQIARDGAVPIVLDTGVGGERVSYTCVDTPAGSVLRILADTYGYGMHYRDGAYHVSSLR